MLGSDRKEVREERLYHCIRGSVRRERREKGGMVRESDVEGEVRDSTGWKV